jgi:hypothetical protein
MTKEDVEIYTGVGIVTAVVVAAVSVLAFTLAHLHEIATGFILLLFQILLSSAAIVIACAVSYWAAASLVGKATEAVVKKIADLQHRYDRELQALRKRSPTLLAFVTLTGETWALTADKSFKEDVSHTLSVSFLLMVAFTVSTELINSAHPWKRAIGLSLWILGLAYLPAAIIIDRGLSLSQILILLANLNLNTKLVIGLSLVLLSIAPIAMSSDESDEQHPVATTSNPGRSAGR